MLEGNSRSCWRKLIRNFDLVQLIFQVRNTYLNMHGHISTDVHMLGIYVLRTQLTHLFSGCFSSTPKTMSYIWWLPHTSIYQQFAFKNFDWSWRAKAFRFLVSDVKSFLSPNRVTWRDEREPTGQRRWWWNNYENVPLKMALSTKYKTKNFVHRGKTNGTTLHFES